ncbi:hypothetical protein GCM10027280_10600 [Micromonospora polyrhachis]
MASTYRTKDGHSVRVGDQVWAQNGTGPFIITRPAGLKPGWVLLLHAGGDDDQRLHAPEDITIYYHRVRPVQSWER